MKEYKKEGKTIREYTFNDWEDGSIGGNLKAGMRKITDSKTGDVYYNFISKEEYDKIDVNRQDIYWEKVTKELDGMSDRFEEIYDQSDDPERLLELETNKYEQIFNKDLKIPNVQAGNEPLIPGLKFSIHQIKSYRDIYYRIIVKGEREFKHTNSPKYPINVNSDRDFINVEAIAKYIEWLKSFHLGGLNFYSADPDKEGKKISFWQYIQSGGGIKELKRRGLTINPTHDFNLLVPVREKLSKKKEKLFIEERRLNKLETTDLEIEKQSQLKESQEEQSTSYYINLPFYGKLLE